MAGGGGNALNPPVGYEERYELIVGTTANFDGAITLDLSITGATIVAEIDDGEGNWTELDSATANFIAATKKTLATIFGTAIPWTVAAPLEDRYFRVRVSGGTPALTEFVLQIGLEVIQPPTIADPAISAASITQDGSVIITATLTDTTRAWVTVINADGSVEYSKDMTITAGAGSATIQGRYLPAGTYAAGQIEIHVADSAGTLAAKSATLALAVTASTSSYQMQAADALQIILQADSRLAGINDDDIIIATDEGVVDNLPTFPAIILIPDTDEPMPHSVTMRRHKVRVWCLVASQHLMARLEYSDITEPVDNHEWVRAVLDVCEEENEDPDERLGNLVQTIHAARANPKLVPAKSLYVNFIQIDAEIIAK